MMMNVFTNVFTIYQVQLNSLQSERVGGFG